MLDYYEQRALEYERIYAKPERQNDLLWLKERVRGLLGGRRVLEVACGTGYWTEVVAPEATFLLATDGANGPLEVARRKTWPEGRVVFGLADAYSLEAIRELDADVERRVADFGPFDALMAGFWWSHVARRNLRAFLETACRATTPGARLVFFDNRYIEGSSTPIARRDSDGNTYQVRRLDDGSEHEVLKNFPDEEELLAAVTEVGADVRVEMSSYFWILSFTKG